MSAFGMTPLLIEVQPLIAKLKKSDEDYSDIMLLYRKASPTERTIIDKWEEEAKKIKVEVKHDFTGFQCDKSHAGPCDHSSSTIVDLESSALKFEEKTDVKRTQKEKENEKPAVNRATPGRRFSLSVNATPAADAVNDGAVKVNATVSRLTFS